MSKFNIIARFSLREYFGLPRDEKQRKRKIATMVILAACFAPLVVLICLGVYFFAGQIAISGGLAGLIGSIMMAAQIIVIFFGTASYLTVMYFSRDNEFLASLPISTMAVYMSKLLIVYLSNLIISVAVVLPATIVAGVAASIAGVTISAHYYIMAVIGSLLVPLLPLLAVAIISVPVAYIARIFKRSSIATTIITMVLFIGTYIGYMALVMSIASNAVGSDITQIIPNIVVMLNAMAKVLYPNYWIASAMTASGTAALLNSIYYLLTIVAASALLLVLTRLTYRKCSTKFMEINYSSREGKRSVKKRSQIKAIIVRDIKSIMREPGLAINCIMGVIMAPLLAAILGSSSGMSGTTQGGDSTMQASMVLMMSMMMLIGTNYLANIAVSREGDKFYMVKYMPIKTEDYIKAKTYIADAYILLGSVLVAIMMLIIGINVVGALLGAANIIALGYAVTAISIKKDLNKPNLNWLNSRSLMKSRTNILVMMLVSVVEAVALMIFLMFMAKVIINTYVLYAVVYGIGLLINITLAIVFRKDLSATGVSLFNKIEANNG